MPGTLIQAVRRLQRPGPLVAGLAHRLLRRRQHRLARACARLAVALAPRDARSYSALALAAHQSGRIGEATAACRALGALPDAPAALRFGAATILYENNEVTDCLALLAPLVQGSEPHPHAPFLQAVAWLKSGDFKRGWPAYETRASPMTRGKAATASAPRWRGEPLAGKRILVSCEQGFGDCLQFVRFVPLLKARGAHTILWSYPELRTLFAQSGVADEIVTGDNRPAADYVTVLGSIPALLGTTMETIPAPIPYLRAQDDAVAVWRRRWPADLFRIGIVWGGAARAGHQPLNEIDRRRSFPPLLLNALADVPAQWVSLQMGDHGLKHLPVQPRLTMDDPTGELKDFADSAALCETLDLVITVDTSVAHLAGALGRPVWMLSRFDACWRWLLERTDTPWYPNMRIFRQPKPGDWASVLAEVAAALPHQIRGGRTPARASGAPDALTMAAAPGPRAGPR